MLRHFYKKGNQWIKRKKNVTPVRHKILAKPRKWWKKTTKENTKKREKEKDNNKKIKWVKGTKKGHMKNETQLWQRWIKGSIKHQPLENEGPSLSKLVAGTKIKERKM